MALTLLPYQSSFWSLFNDPKALGEATLIAIGAIVVGMIVRRIWPANFNPVLFGSLAAVGLVAALSYLGVASAGLVLWLFIGAAIIFGIAGLALGGL